jgi:RNA polymerase sigma-70 factor (ECF subfamily)
METPDLPERNVFERAAQGDKDALTVVFRAFQPTLLRYLRGRLPDAADDLAAQTWLDAVRNFGRFSGGAEDFRRWLFTIARRRVQDDLRRRGRRPEEVTSDPPDEPRRDDALQDHDDLARALALVRRLPPDQADAVLLRIVAGMDVGQVAEVMGRSEGSVRVLVHRGLQRLRELAERVTWMLV